MLQWPIRFKENITVQSTQLIQFLMDKADDMKAEEIVSLSVQGKSDITDAIIVCTGNSKRHVLSIAENITKKSKEAGIEPYDVGGEDDGEWVIVDMGSVMIHIMQEEPRNLYQLEKLGG